MLLRLRPPKQRRRRQILLLHALRRQLLRNLRQRKPNERLQPDHVPAAHDGKASRLLRLPGLLQRSLQRASPQRRTLVHERHRHDGGVVREFLPGVDADDEVRGCRVRTGMLLRGQFARLRVHGE